VQGGDMQGDDLRSQRYVGDWGGFQCKEGPAPVRSKSGKIKCVRSAGQ
jgi:hypothetical protein